MNETITKLELSRNDANETGESRVDSSPSLDALSLLQENNGKKEKIGKSESRSGQSDPFELKIIPLSTVIGMTASTGTIRASISMNDAYNTKLALLNPEANPDIFREGSFAKSLAQTQLKVGLLKTLEERAVDELHGAQTNLNTALKEASEVNRSYIWTKFNSPAEKTDPSLVKARKDFLWGDRTKYPHGHEVKMLGLNGRKASDYVGSAMEVEKSIKLFEEGTREANMLHGVERTQLAEIKAQHNLTEITSKLNAQQTELARLKVQIPKLTSKANVLNEFNSGVALSAASMIAGHYVDEAMGLESPVNSLGRATIDGLIVPTILSSAITKPMKIVLASASFGASRVLGVLEQQAKAENEDKTSWFTIRPYNDAQQEINPKFSLKNQLKTLGAR